MEHIAIFRIIGRTPTFVRGIPAILGCGWHIRKQQL
jgi:hypothetical protein